MSYCRFSSDDYQCDVYCYEDVSGGFTTHVAGSRPVLDGTLPPPVPFDRENIAAFMARHEKAMAWLERAELRDIDLPHAGECFNDPDAASAAARLQMLKDAGYNVPQYAIDALREEAADEAKANARANGTAQGE